MELGDFHYYLPLNLIRYELLEDFEISKWNQD